MGPKTVASAANPWRLQSKPGMSHSLKPKGTLPIGLPIKGAQEGTFSLIMANAVTIGIESDRQLKNVGILTSADEHSNYLLSLPLNC